jgi:biotin synthase
MPSSASKIAPAPTRHDWTVAEAEALISKPFMDLMYEAQTIHRRHFDPQTIQVSTLLNVKTGGCAENCGYCSQSAHHETELAREKLLDVDAVLAQARAARAAGIGRFCMGAAWRKPTDKDLDRVIAMVEGVKALGMESCVTLGMLTEAQAKRLKEAGLDWYNHNLDTSREYYDKVVTTRSYDDRLETLRYVREQGISVCAGGILGLGESRRDRAAMLVELANLPQHPQSVPLNKLVKVPGTPLSNVPDLDDIEFVRAVAAARVMMPLSFVRLSAGRDAMSDEAQALCFLAGANSLFYGDKLLTTDNATTDRDKALFAKLDLKALSVALHADH